MTRLFAAVLLVLLSVGLTPPPVSSLVVVDVPAAAAQAQQDPATLTVYVTRTGEKYHREGCRYLSRRKIATSLREAR